MSFMVMVLAGLACGFVDSCLGMGYGVTATSVLITFGVPPAIASASIHTSETVVDIASALAHYRNGNVNLHISRQLLIPGIIASVLGAVFITRLDISTAKPLVRAILILLGLTILYETHNGETVKRGLSKLKAMGLGFTAAFIDVAVGGGWGPIGTPALILSGEEPSQAVGVIEFTEPIISLTAVLSFAILIGWEQFMWDLAIPMIIGGVILAPVASMITRRLPRKTLGTLIGLWLVALNLYGLTA